MIGGKRRRLWGHSAGRRVRAAFTGEKAHRVNESGNLRYHHDLFPPLTGP